MQLNKPAEVPQFENERNLILGQEPVTVKVGVLLGLGAKAIKSSSVKIDAPEIEGPICLLSSLQTFKTDMP